MKLLRGGETFTITQGMCFISIATLLNFHPYHDDAAGPSNRRDDPRFVLFSPLGNAENNRVTKKIFSNVSEI